MHDLKETIIRAAIAADAPALRAIYAPFVERTATSFEAVPPTVEEFAQRIRKVLDGGWAWLVAESYGRCAGYAYGSLHREREAYRWSVETTVYVHTEHQRRGIGRALYTALFAVLTEKGFCNAFAGVTLPNDASVALHRSVGFQPIGTFRAVGRKFGRWHDVAWFQRPLRDAPISE